MGTTVSIIIGAIGVLGSIIYLINETIKVRREPEKREELYRLRKEEEKKLIEEFNALSLSIANNIKYRIRDEQFIDILINKEVLGGYRISKDKELLLDNGTFSLVADDFEVCQDIRIESYSYRDSFGGAAGIRD